jgi:hypothetical protein
MPPEDATKENAQMPQNKNPEKLDKNMVRLVRALNAFKGVTTIGSCGGHPNHGPAQSPAGTFYVKFDLSWDRQGQFALEFLAWMVNEYMHATTKGRVMLRPVSPPPYLNRPGTCLHFAIDGFDGADPEQLATELNQARRRYFIPPREEMADAQSD